ncbi:unnamed protein product, partial [Phaeothamnion confervicola]
IIFCVWCLRSLWPHSYGCLALAQQSKGKGFESAIALDESMHGGCGTEYTYGGFLFYGKLGDPTDDRLMATRVALSLSLFPPAATATALVAITAAVPFLTSLLTTVL